MGGYTTYLVIAIGKLVQNDKTYIMRFVHVRFVPKFTTLFFKVASYGRDRIVEERARRFVFSLESPGLCGDQCTKFVISYVTTD